MACGWMPRKGISTEIVNVYGHVYTLRVSHRRLIYHFMTLVIKFLFEVATIDCFMVGESGLEKLWRVLIG